MKNLSENRMLFAVISGVVIFGVSTLVGWVFFGILQSSAEATLQNWKLGGGIAGFGFSALLLTSIIFQFYKQVTADEVSRYREQVMELQSKLVRGAPAPEGYVIEVDEKHKLIFSRPQTWPPLGGILYQYMLRKKDPFLPEKFNPNFNVVYLSKNDLADFYEQYMQQSNAVGTFDPEKVNVDKLYEDCLNASVQVGLAVAQNTFGSYENVSLTKEFVLVDGIKSLKAILTYTVTLDGEKKTKMTLCQCAVLTYVPRLEALYSFTFTDVEENYLKSSEIFNNVFLSIRFLP